jgi:hypothetical protein
MTTAIKTAYRITSRVYQGGGTQSTHRTLSGAERAMKRHDAAIRYLNRNGGSSYHDCRIEVIEDGRWVLFGS